MCIRDSSSSPKWAPHIVSGALNDCPTVGPLALYNRAFTSSGPRAYRIAHARSPEKFRYTLSKCGIGAIGLKAAN
eukprot:12265060-Prorocentrum_lima.AAC.1